MKAYSWEQIIHMVQVSSRKLSKNYSVCYDRWSLRIEIEKHGDIDNCLIHKVGYISVIDGSCHGYVPLKLAQPLLLNRNEMHKMFNEIMNG